LKKKYKTITYFLGYNCKRTYIYYGAIVVLQIGIVGVGSKAGAMCLVGA